MSRFRSECTYHVRICRNLDSQRGVRGACHCFGDCETSAYGKLSKANRGGAEGHSQGTRGDETNERVPRQSG